MQTGHFFVPIAVFLVPTADTPKNLTQSARYSGSKTSLPFLIRLSVHNGFIGIGAPIQI